MHARGIAAAALLLVVTSCVSPSVDRAAPPPPAMPPLPAVATIPAPLRVLPQVRIQGDLAQGGVGFGTVSPADAVVTFGGDAVPVAPDGRFLVGFGRDHGPSAAIEARLPDGAVVRQQLAIAPRSWNIQSLPTLPKGTKPTPEFLARRKQELARINAARRLESKGDGWRQTFVWPATGRISGVFGSQRIYAGEPGDPHSGVDVARPTGTRIVAPADGVVILAAAAPFTLEGHLLMIDHGMGLNSAFLHLSRIDVKEGDRVRQGQPVGVIGATGRATGPHLHWGMMLRGVRIDPQRLAGPMPGG